MSIVVNDKDDITIMIDGTHSVTIGVFKGRVFIDIDTPDDFVGVWDIDPEDFKKVVDSLTLRED